MSEQETHTQRPSCASVWCCLKAVTEKTSKTKKYFAPCCTHSWWQKQNQQGEAGHLCEGEHKKNNTLKGNKKHGVQNSTQIYVVCVCGLAPAFHNICSCVSQDRRGSCCSHFSWEYFISSKLQAVPIDVCTTTLRTVVLWVYLPCTNWFQCEVFLSRATDEGKYG